MNKPILYVKITENNKQISEYFIDQAEFTLGFDLTTDHCSLQPGMPRKIQLLKKAGQEYLFFVPDTVTGQIQQQDSTIDIASLIIHGLIISKNNFIELKIKPGQTGKIAWDQLLIEFDFRFNHDHFAERIHQLEQERKEKNRHAKTYMNQVERVYFILLVMSLLIHGSIGLYAYLKKLPPPAQVTVKEIPKRFARLVLEPPPVVKKAQPKVIKTDDLAGKTSSTSEKKESEGKSGAQSGGDGKKAGGSADGKRDVRSMGVLGIISAQGQVYGSNPGIQSLQATGIAQTLDSAFGKTGKGAGGGDGDGFGEGNGLPFVASFGNGAWGDVVNKDVVTGPVTSVNLERAGNVTFNDPSSVSGEASSSIFRTPGAIRKAILTQMEGIRYCFNQSLKQNSDLAGKLSLEFTILANGSVANVRVADMTINDPKLTECVLSVVKNWRFQPIALGDVEVNYPLVFTPKQ